MPLLDDSMFQPNTSFGQGGWLGSTIANLQQGGSPMLSGIRQPQLPALGPNFGQSPVAGSGVAQGDRPPPPTSPDPTSPPPTTAGAGGTIPETSLLGRIGGAINAHPQTLLKMAAGFAGAPNLGQGMSRAFGGAAEGLQADQKQQALGQTYQALVKAGVPPAQAMAAIAAQQAGNTSLLSQLAAKHLGPQHLMNVDNQLRHPITGELVAQGPPKIETLQSGTPGIPNASVQRNGAGQLEVIDPSVLGRVGTAPVRVNRFEDALRLPPGTRFVDPMGIERVR